VFWLQRWSKFQVKLNTGKANLKRLAKDKSDEKIFERSEKHTARRDQARFDKAEEKKDKQDAKMTAREAAYKATLAKRAIARKERDAKNGKYMLKKAKQSQAVKLDEEKKEKKNVVRKETRVSFWNKKTEAVK